MCTCFTSSITFLIYFVAINIFALFLKVCFFQNYLECLIREKVEIRPDVYDYIVVGSGSAGSIVAQRLSEDKKLKILLIDAGSYGNQLFDIPAVGPMLQNSPYDWQYRTVPQKKACLGLQNQVSYWPMGKIVGGTSRLNNMIYIRGHPQDFSSWYKNTNFDYNLDIKPYFNKVENSDDNLMATDVPFLSNIADNFLKAAVAQNYSTNNGLHSQPGFTFPKATILNGARFSSYHRLKNLKKNNLHVIINSLVEKVLIKNNYEAYGVRFIHLDKYHEVTAKKGVILSAGVIGTPKILMLSGIGPAKHLKKINITPILNLPAVGNHLQDHVTTGFDLILLDVKPNVGISSILSPMSAFSYFVHSKGPWATTGCEGLAFFNKSEEIPDLQFMMLPLGTTSDNGIYLRTLVGVPDRLWRDYFSKINQPAITILPLVLHPRSRGTVRLKDKNVKSAPLIDPNYLADDYDVKMLIQGIETIKKWIKTKPFQELGAKLNSHTFPGCENHVFDSKVYWECYVRHLTITSYHPVGTCRMGEVVDYDFRVKGTSGLWVVDGSVLPNLPSGNPNAAIMMMAEMASDKIKYHQWLIKEKTSAKEIFVDKIGC